MSHALVQFSYLQLLDLLTTVAFLIHGVQEANPFVLLAFRVVPSPLLGLVAVKMLALALGFYCWRVAKVRLLVRINWMFAFVVAWNLVALIVNSLGVVQPSF